MFVLETVFAAWLRGAPPSEANQSTNVATHNGL